MDNANKTTVRTFSEIIAAPGFDHGKRRHVREWSTNGQIVRWEVFAVTAR